MENVKNYRNIVSSNIYSNERALYNSTNLDIISCRFEGDEDGESALKECRNIYIEESYFALRYPLWHNEQVTIKNSEFTLTCRAPIWYTKKLELIDSTLNGPKSFRECDNTVINNSIINSDEAFWKCRDILVKDSNLSGGYLFFNSSSVKMIDTIFSGKYSFQYVFDVSIKGCKLNTKDAFWHSKNVTVYNSIIEGEYLGWYSSNLTLVNCHIKGTQPLCYCKGLKIINCTFEDADLAFENSEVDAVINSSMISIKNPLSGKISVEDAEIIYDEQNKYNGNCEIIIRDKEDK